MVYKLLLNNCLLLLKIWLNILIIDNTKLTIIADPIRVICFYNVTDFTDHDF